MDLYYPINQLGLGPGIMRGPADKLEVGADAASLGQAVLAVLARSSREKWDGYSPVSRDKAPAGFKSFGQLEDVALYLHVHRDGETYHVAAWAASDDGGYVPVNGAERTCTGDPIALGQLVRELSKLCVPRRAKPRSRKNCGKPAPHQPARDPNDLPVSFGYKMTWIAVPSTDPRYLADCIRLQNLKPCSWSDGIERAYEHSAGVFITPPVDGWTLAVGTHPEVGTPEFVPYLEDLSRRFGLAFYFGTHRVGDYHAWAIAEAGKLKRAFAIPNLINIGERTPEEEELAIGTEEVGSRGWPGEDEVLALASKWVLDPREIDLETEAFGPGWFGIPIALG